MAKLTAGITGWGRGAVSGIQMQTMRGKTFIRAKQPPLGPGNANQQAYRDKFSFIQSQMKVPTQYSGFGSKFYSSVEIEERNAVLRQNLAAWPVRVDLRRTIIGDNYLWERVHGRLHYFGVTSGNLQFDAYTAPPDGTKYYYILNVKYTDGTVREFSGNTSSVGTRVIDITANFGVTGKTFKQMYVLIMRTLLSSERPYLLATGMIYETGFGPIVKGNITFPSWLATD